MSRWARARGLAAALVTVALLSGCSALPSSGPVVVESYAEDDQTAAPIFLPPGPRADAEPDEIVRGFLLAMRANPATNSVARKFLTKAAQASWRPDQQTLLYDRAAAEREGSAVVVQLTSTDRLDKRGGWQSGAGAATETLELTVVLEDGQWRVDNPPDALVLPKSVFEDRFRRYDLYFYDPARRVLVPEAVFLPQNDQVATNLVRSLLVGPSPGRVPRLSSALPASSALDLAVVVSAGGLADVPLTAQVRELPPEQLQEVTQQLAWTLSQVPGIARLRISVDGVPVPLARGRVAFGLDGRRDWAPSAAEVSDVWYAVRDGEVVQGNGESFAAVDGPLGTPGFALRSLAVSEAQESFAAVSANARTVFVAPASGSGAQDRVARVYTGAEVLRPAYDVFGGLWLVDRGAEGARVVLVPRRGRTRTFSVPGVSGRAVRALAVSRDGARIAFLLNDAQLAVAEVIRSADGAVEQIGTVRLVPGRSAVPGAVVDLCWRDSATLAVLARPNDATSRLSYVGFDGSPAGAGFPDPAVYAGQGAALVCAGQRDQSLRMLTGDGRLVTLLGNGQWRRSGGGFTAAAFPQ